MSGSDNDRTAPAVLQIKFYNAIRIAARPLELATFRLRGQPHTRANAHTCERTPPPHTQTHGHGHVHLHVHIHPPPHAHTRTRTHTHNHANAGTCELCKASNASNEVEEAEFTMLR